MQTQKSHQPTKPFYPKVKQRGPKLYKPFEKEKDCVYNVLTYLLNQIADKQQNSEWKPNGNLSLTQQHFRTQKNFSQSSRPVCNKVKL